MTEHARLSMNIRPERKADLEARAEAASMSSTAYVLRALSILAWHEDLPEGTKIFVQKPDQAPDANEVVFL